MSDFSVQIACECGNLLDVRNSQAGTHLTCPCGKILKAPSLGKLRQLAGKDAYVTNPAEAIRKSVLAGVNPAGDVCIVCGSRSPQEFECNAECESVVVKNSPETSNSYVSFLARFGAVLLLPKLLLLFLLRGRVSGQEPTEFGHEVSVSFPLPVCRPCVESGHNPCDKRTAKELMRKVTLYRQLLDYYPKLVLSVQKSD